ncbi:MAG: hypothetical protein IT376_19400 [Polyangiaceae bacterium]|nr:hypothetical protein [Polyangiaceae bacterium]
MDVLVYAVSFALQIVTPWWLVRRDERRLAPRERARAWNEATFRLAVVVFGPLAVATHFLRTRRTVRGLALGLLASALTALPASAVGALAELWLDEPSPTVGEALASMLLGAAALALVAGILAALLVGADVAIRRGARALARAARGAR